MTEMFFHQAAMDLKFSHNITPRLFVACEQALLGSGEQGGEMGRESLQRSLSGLNICIESFDAKY